MNEPEGAPAAELSATEPLTTPPEAPAPAAGLPSAGQQLQAAREAAGQPLDALAQTLKVAVRKLEALEADRLDELPSPMFTRALASSVCRVLNIDPAPVLSRLPQSDQYSFERAQVHLNAPFRASHPRPMAVVVKQLKNPLALLVLALLVGALALFLVPSIPPLDNLVDRLKGAAAPATGPAAVALGGNVTVDVTPTGAALPPTKPVVAASDVLLPALTSASSLNAQAAVPPGVVGFKARAEVWIEVTDAKGRTPLRRLVNAGEAVQVDGALPMVATVGRADVVDVEVRGKPFDITTRSKDNVARFEVK
ncbi:MAG: helix-turn-helix domain-containing protein [Pseudomonadota bacterium]